MATASPEVGSSSSRIGVFRNGSHAGNADPWRIPLCLTARRRVLASGAKPTDSGARQWLTTTAVGFDRAQICQRLFAHSGVGTNSGNNC